MDTLYGTEAGRPQVQRILIPVQVNWNMPIAGAENYPGVLMTNLVSVKLSGEDVTQTLGLADAQLFEVTFWTDVNGTAALGTQGTAIICNTPLAVYVGIRMNQPADQAQYNQVAGEQISVKVSFNIDIPAGT
jgi:hypothetical protein